MAMLRLARLQWRLSLRAGGDGRPIGGNRHGVIHRTIARLQITDAGRRGVADKLPKEH
jgi:hypothetical protein